MYKKKKKERKKVRISIVSIIIINIIIRNRISVKRVNMYNSIRNNKVWKDKWRDSWSLPMTYWKKAMVKDGKYLTGEERGGGSYHPFKIYIQHFKLVFNYLLLYSRLLH